MTKLTMRRGFVSGLVVVMASGFIFAQPVCGQASKNQLQFNDYLLAPVRIHLLSAKDSPAIQTTLTESDITRILAKINGVWAQARLRMEDGKWRKLQSRSLSSALSIVHFLVSWFPRKTFCLF